MKLSTLFTGALLLFLSSCTTAGMVKTASTLKTKADIHSLTIADLEVSPERVTHTIHPSDEILRGGEENAKRAAEAEVLAAHNNADVLVDAQYVITKDNGSLFKRPKITSITVTGHPAHYKNYHSVAEKLKKSSSQLLNSTSAEQNLKAILMHSEATWFPSTMILMTDATLLADR